MNLGFGVDGLGLRVNCLRVQGLPEGAVCMAAIPYIYIYTYACTYIYIYIYIHHGFLS